VTTLSQFLLDLLRKDALIHPPTGCRTIVGYTLKGNTGTASVPIQQGITSAIIGVEFTRKTNATGID